MSRIDNSSSVIWILRKNHLPIVKLSLIAKSTSLTPFFAHWFPPYCLFTYNSSTHKPTNKDKQWVFWKSNHVIGSEDQFKPCRCILHWRASGNHEGGGSEFTFMHQSIPPTPKCPTPGTDKVGKCPAVARGGGWVQGELTDALNKSFLRRRKFMYLMIEWIINVQVVFCLSLPSNKVNDTLQLITNFLSFHLALQKFQL